MERSSGGDRGTFLLRSRRDTFSEKKHRDDDDDDEQEGG